MRAREGASSRGEASSTAARTASLTMLPLRRLLCDGHQALVPRREALDRREATRHGPGVCEQLQPLDSLSHGAAVLAEHIADDRDVHVEGW